MSDSKTNAPWCAWILSLLLLASQIASATAIDDANNVVTQLNPISAAVSSLIGQARDAGDSILQRRLEQFNGIIQLAIDRANEVARMRIEDIDERVARQMRGLNSYVATDLAQLQSLTRASLRQADQILVRNSDRFTGGLGNAICSVDFLTTLPVLQIGTTGITTYAQKGKTTQIYVPGSCLAKVGIHPEARLINPANRSGEGVPLNTVASLGLLSLDIPNSLIPPQVEPTDFELHLTFQTGRRWWVLWPTYVEQAVPLHICGIVPKLHVHVVVRTSGKAYERMEVPHPELPFMDRGVHYEHLSSDGGNGNSKRDFTLPAASPVEGWDIDRSPNDYGMTFKMLASEGHWSIDRISPYVIRFYTDGSDGKAYLSGYVGLKLYRLVPEKPCLPPVEWDQPLRYGARQEMDIEPKVTASVGADCEAARSAAPPETEVQVTVLDDAGHQYGSRYLRPNVPAEFLGGTAEITLDEKYHLAIQAEPSCERQSLPREAGKPNPTQQGPSTSDSP